MSCFLAPFVMAFFAAVIPNDVGLLFLALSFYGFCHAGLTWFWSYDSTVKSLALHYVIGFLLAAVPLLAIVAANSGSHW